MQILLPDAAYAAHRARLADVDGPVEWVRIGPNGSLVFDDKPLDPKDAKPEIAWGTAHMFYDETIEPFFKLLLTGNTIRWFQSPAAGIDEPVFATIVRRGIRLTTSHGNSIAIAEYVLGAVLRTYQRPEEFAAAQRDREWRHHEFRELYGTTWMVIGVGAIGRAVAERARAFNAHVIGVRRNPTGDEPVDEMITPDDVAGALPRAEVVVLCVPATPQTEQLVDPPFLAAMRDSSILVNVGRGSLVDEQALLAALDRGRPETAILDVFETEPLPPASRFWDHPRAVVTPHASAGGLGRHDRNTELFLDNLARYRAGAPLRHEVTEADLAG